MFVFEILREHFTVRRVRQWDVQGSQKPYLPIETFGLNLIIPMVGHKPKSLLRRFQLSLIYFNFICGQLLHRQPLIL